MPILTLVSGNISKAHHNDAGFDIHASEDCTIYPQSSASIPTELRIRLPLNHFALVKPRSGMSFKNHIETGAGVIDEGYTGEIKVKLYNNSDNPFHITKNQSIAQLVILPMPSIQVEVEGGAFSSPDTLINRDTKGFGSSDKTMNEQLDQSAFNLGLSSDA